MHRRRFLGALFGTTVAGTAGCVGGEFESTSTPPVTQREPRQEYADVDLPVPREEMRHPFPQDHIAAIVSPAFADDWSVLDGNDTTLPPDAPVLGVSAEGTARAYPLRILDRHEVVNDELQGPIAVTYCVLCGSGVVVERRVAGEVTRFGVSGSLWRSDLVLYDEATESLWSQLLATAIRGPRTGDQLRIRPSTLTTLAEWREQYPGTQVLLPPPESETLNDSNRGFEYCTPRYSYGEEEQIIGRDSFDGGLHTKTMVMGIRSDGEATAYPFHVVGEENVVTDKVGERPVVVTTTPDNTLVAYIRRVAGETVSFAANGTEKLEADGSNWERTTGRALDGPHQGATLNRANDHPPMFWVGWSNFNPDTAVYGVEYREEEQSAPDPQRW